LVGQDAVIIGQEQQESVNQDVKPFFDEVKQLPDIAIMRNGRDELHLQVYYCKNFHLPAQPHNNLPLYRQLQGKAPFGN